MNGLKYYKENEHALPPKFATDGSACFDLSACLRGVESVKTFTNYGSLETRPVKDEGITINVGERMLVPTGLIFEIPKGYSIRVHPRSGLAIKNGIALCNMEGVIDSDYVEGTFITLWNLNLKREYNSFHFSHGDRLSQGEMVKTLDYDMKETKERPQRWSDRSGGFGSTGVEKT